MTKFYRPIGDKACVFPVGSIYLSVVDTNPSKWFGGTWVQMSQGRFLMGVGIPDNNNITDFGELNYNNYLFRANDMGGQYMHTLTVDEIPSHSHWVPAINYEAQPGSNTAVAGTTYHKNQATQRSVPTGGDMKHNNMPPYYCVYVWKRTA